MAGGGASADGSYLAIMGDEDTITGFLLAGVGNVDLRKNSNFLIVNESKDFHLCKMLLPYLASLSVAATRFLWLRESDTLQRHP